MTMIPLSSPATSGLNQTSPPWGHCIRFSGARFVSQTFLSPCHCLFSGLLQRHPGAVLPSRAPAGFLPRGPCFRPLLSCGVRPKLSYGFKGRGSSRNRFGQVNGISSIYFNLFQLKRSKRLEHPLAWNYHRRLAEDDSLTKRC